MKTYNVKEVAKILSTSEETVRRWIRSGKLQASMDSRKGGSVITEAMLKEFVKGTPKYATALVGSVGGIVAASTVLLGSIMAATITKNEEIKNSKVGADEIEKILIEKINDLKEQIRRKRVSLVQLEKEIQNEELDLQNLQYLLREMRTIDKQKGEKRDE